MIIAGIVLFYVSLGTGLAGIVREPWEPRRRDATRTAIAMLLWPFVLLAGVALFFAQLLEKSDQRSDEQ